jgi:hypothetical protein
VGADVFIGGLTMVTEIEIKDDMQILADFMYSMILKYSDKVDLDSLPDPEVLFLMQDIRKFIKLSAEKRKEKDLFDIEYVLFT